MTFCSLVVKLILWLPSGTEGCTFVLLVLLRFKVLTSGNPENKEKTGCREVRNKTPAGPGVFTDFSLQVNFLMSLNSSSHRVLGRPEHTAPWIVAPGLAV